MQRQTIQRLLSEKAGGSGADSSAIADAAVRTWTRAASVLAPLIGEGGMRALYTRSLHLTRSTFPWLATVEEPAQVDAPFTDLRASLEHREPVEAIDASTALLVTFAELLVTLIGEALSMRLLSSAWADGDPGTTTQETQA